MTERAKCVSPIDIDAVAKNLKELNAEETALQKKIAEFCEELGINRPFYS